MDPACRDACPNSTSARVGSCRSEARDRYQEQIHQHVLKDGLLFGDDGHFFCANVQTGATLWEHATTRGNSAALVDAGTAMLANA